MSGSVDGPDTWCARAVGAAWQQFTQQEPEFAAEVRQSLDAAPHHVLAHGAGGRLGADHARWVREVRPPIPDAHLFRLDMTEVVLTGLAAERTHRVIRSWQPGRGVRTFHRT